MIFSRPNPPGNSQRSTDPLAGFWVELVGEGKLGEEEGDGAVSTFVNRSPPFDINMQLVKYLCLNAINAGSLNLWVRQTGSNSRASLAWVLLRSTRRGMLVWLTRSCGHSPPGWTGVAASLDHRCMGVTYTQARSYHNQFTVHMKIQQKYNIHTKP